MQLHPIATFVLLAMGAFAAAAEAAEMRTWTAGGGFTIEAELVALKPGDIVRLKTKDGREIDVPLGQLSAADRDYIQTPAPAGAANPAPAAVVRFGGHRYSFVEGRVSWNDARQKCEEMGGYLACITTPAEQAFLVKGAPKAEESPAQGKFWIGGFLRDGRWQWLSGERSNFAPNRPAADPSEPYLRLMVNTNRWLGEQENSTLIQGFICEWNK